MGLWQEAYTKEPHVNQSLQTADWHGSQTTLRTLQSLLLITRSSDKLSPSPSAQSESDSGKKGTVLIQKTLE